MILENIEDSSGIGLKIFFKGIRIGNLDTRPPSIMTPLLPTNKIPDKFESESDSFFDRVINGFKMIARKEPNRCKLINAVNTKEETAEQVIFEIKNYYEKMYPAKSTKMKM